MSECVNYSKYVRFNVQVAYDSLTSTFLQVPVPVPVVQVPVLGMQVQVQAPVRKNCT